MKNYVQPGDTLTLTAPYDLTSGLGVLVGSIFGVASADALTGAEVEAVRKGVFDLKKKAATAITAGAKVYWDNTAREVNTTATANTLIGAAAVAAGASDATVTVVLDGAVR